MSGSDLLIVGVVTAVLIPLISAAVNATRTQRASAAVGRHVLVLTYPRGFKVLSIAALVVCLAMGIMIAFVVDAESQLDRVLGILIVVLPLTALSAWLLYEATGRQLAITDAGLETRSPRRTTFLAWADIEDLQYSFLNSWLVIRGPTGVRIRASRYLNGTQDLYEALNRHVRPAVLADARRSLEVFRQLSVTKRGAA